MTPAEIVARCALGGDEMPGMTPKEREVKLAAFDNLLHHRERTIRWLAETSLHEAQLAIAIAGKGEPNSETTGVDTRQDPGSGGLVGDLGGQRVDDSPSGAQPEQPSPGATCNENCGDGKCSVQCMYADPAPQPSEQDQEKARASVWFVESVIDGKSEGWWSQPPKGMGGWLTQDPHQAKRYTKAEAEAVAAALSYFPAPFRWSNWVATEHLFMDVSTAERAEGLE